MNKAPYITARELLKKENAEYVIYGYFSNGRIIEFQDPDLMKVFYSHEEYVTYANEIKESSNKLSLLLMACRRSGDSNS